jgi:hypothetical protein
MESQTGLSPKILQAIIDKSNLGQQVSDNTYAVMQQTKEILHELAADLDEELEEKLDEQVRIEYRDRGKYEAHFVFGENMLIFSMHTDVFQFSREDAIWKNPYVTNAPANGYCGIITVWNFLKDSFEHKRLGDEGYLVARIFVNRDMQFFVEGKRQSEFRREAFGSRAVDKEALTDIIEAAIDYSLQFDLLVPPYDSQKTVEAEQFNTKFENSKMRTGKRLDYEFRTDDI